MQKLSQILAIIDTFASESDVDGRGIMFQFTKTDLRELKDSIENLEWY